jgi:hypothetical protein
MKVAWVLLGSIVCTIVLLGLELSHDDMRLAFVIVLLVNVLIREHFRAVWWYRPFFLAWLGTNFLIANWLQIRGGGHSEAALVTFAPFFLVLAAYEIIRRRWSTRPQSNIEVNT